MKTKKCAQKGFDRADIVRDVGFTSCKHQNPQAEACATKGGLADHYRHGHETQKEHDDGDGGPQEPRAIELLPAV